MDSKKINEEIDSEKINEEYFKYFLDTTTSISKFRTQNNNFIFTIYKTLIVSSFFNLFGIIMLDKPESINLLMAIFACITAFSFFFATLWYKINKNYANINNAKFDVISEVCKKQNIPSYFHMEYEKYSVKKNHNITTWENLLIFSIPIMLLFILIIVYFLR